MEKLKNKLKWSKKQTSYAWAKYYEEVIDSHDRIFELYNFHKKMMEGRFELPQHIVSEIEEMCEQLGKDLTCPVCFDIIEKGNLKLTGCGHKYCKECYDKIDTCAICRRSINKKQ